MKKPNVLLLFTDQQRFDTIATCGFNHMLTPNLDKLVNEGLHFTHAYTPNPVCVPARHNLLTGLPGRFHGYTANHDHPLDANLPTLPRILSDNGYDTRAIGKMHFRPTRRHSGFNKMELMEEIPRYREDDEYAMYLKEVGLGHIVNIHGIRNLLYMKPQRSLIPEEHHGSTWVGNRSVEYIRNNAGKRPFFLWSSWIAPHPPFDVPDTFADLYQNRELPEPCISETPRSYSADVNYDFMELPPKSKKDFIRRMRELYFASISLVDKNIGKIIDALEEIGQLDNTLIIFTSDHGEMLGDHNCVQKMLPYDSCARIPFVVRYPYKINAGTVRNEFVDLNDILPTVLDVTGLKYPGPHELPGASIFKNSKDRNYQYMEYMRGTGRWISLRDKQYKYNYYYYEGYEELFDLKNDPCESRNLLITCPDDLKVKENHERLKNLLGKHEEKWGLENYAQNGQMLNFTVKEPKTGTRPRQARNSQFHIFPENVTDQKEKESFNTIEEEILEATKDEPVVKLHEYDLDTWIKNGGNPDFVEKIRKEKI